METLTCPKCSGQLRILPNHTRMIKCDYCGTWIDLDDENLSIKITADINETHNYNYRYEDIAKAEASKAKVRLAQIKDNDRKRDIKVAIFAFATIWALYLLSLSPKLFRSIQGLSSKSKEAAGLISAGTYEDYEGKDYKAVQKQLEVLGFTNINTICLNDGIPFIRNFGTVADVTIDGKKEFYSVDYFEPDDLIIIRYH